MKYDRTRAVTEASLHRALEGCRFKQREEQLMVLGVSDQSDFLRPGLSSCRGEKQERRNKAEAWRPLTR